MPSFDIVSELNMHEVSNGVDQSNKEVSTRYDFKGSNARYERNDNLVTMIAPSDFQLQQMLEILKLKLSKRSIDISCMQIEEPELNLNEARQKIILRQGLDSTLTKKIIKLIKDQKYKVQTSIQGEKVRVSGKKRDDLQTVIKFLKDTDLDMPMQFDNFRD